MRIAVAGGTGLVGRMVVDAVGESGHTPVVLARATGVDLVTGHGLDEALAGVSRVVDVANVTTVRRSSAVSFFAASTAALLAAGRRHGIEHHVALSIVGIDRVNLGYYAGKRRQEELVLTGGVPASVLRATQFHEFAAQLLQRGGRFVVVPRMLSRPVAAREVAEVLVETVLAEPVGMAPELCGPEDRQMADLVRAVVRATGARRTVVPVRLPGATGRALAGGGLVPTGPARQGRQTFDEWLAETAGSLPRPGA